ncbi:MAG TPA: hypothetical protein VF378_10470 [Geothrix sp.]
MRLILVPLPSLSPSLSIPVDVVEVEDEVAPVVEVVALWDP